MVKDFDVDRRLLLFDLSVGGHHPSYLKYLVQYWQEQDFSGQLDLVVTPEFEARHGDVATLVAQGARTQLITITPEEVAALPRRRHFRERVQRAFGEWRLLDRYARRLHSDHALLMYFDTAQYPLILRRSLPCGLSGIYFRPTFHYGQFSGFQAGFRDRWQQWRDLWQLKLACGHPRLQYLFSLDPYVVPLVDRWSSRFHCCHLPDPVQIHGLSPEVPEQLRRQLAIDPHRQIFLFFGDLSGRKGLFPLLQAWQQLSPPTRSAACLLLVGAIHGRDRPRAMPLIHQLQGIPENQIITVDRFISESEIQPYFALTDWVLAPYQRHVGMSGILVRAAAAKKPLISTDYGLMGEITRRYQLGLTLDSTNPQAIAQALENCCDPTVPSPGNPATMEEFGALNRDIHFAHRIFSQLA